MRHEKTTVFEPDTVGRENGGNGDRRRPGFAQVNAGLLRRSWDVG
jgi:hypothetical protein